MILNLKVAYFDAVGANRWPTLVRMSSQIMTSAPKIASGKATPAVVHSCRVNRVIVAYRVNKEEQDKKVILVELELTEQQE